MGDASGSRHKKAGIKAKAGDAEAEELRPLKEDQDHLSPRGDQLDPELGGRRTAAASAAVDVPLGAPRQWSFFPQGSGQLEYEGYETWTEEERQAWKDGRLTGKWGILQVSIRTPVRGFASYAAIVYGYLPYVIPLWWALWALRTYLERGQPRFFPTFGLCIAASFAAGNELITKRICKRVFSRQISSRPPEAVCKHAGMPSGHVMNAYTLMVWCLWEAALEDIIHLDWLLLIVLVMGPVPWARVYNKDHTFCQVCVSAVAAVVLGSIAYYIRSAYFPNHDNPWDWEGYSLEMMEMDSSPAVVDTRRVRRR
eukprot:TRINITY_DN32926_c0_g1_i1.p1 TRINITY_DN32926_c0_g1~~TRINITY_DN32926_c0_g1_i1.p1  ORF type:complete len:330 (-),score=53.96 TRINITY_DN32926_c0_g1_i1:250-1182(-)